MTAYEREGATGPDAAPGRRTARVAPLMALPALFAGFGIELAPLVAEAGLPDDLFHHPDNRAPVDTLLQLVVRCVERSACPSLGLRLGKQVQALALGRAGRLLVGAVSVERALRGLIMNLHLNGEAVVPALTVSGDTACLSVTPYAYHAGGGDQLADISLAVSMNVMRFLCGRRWSPTQVTLARRSPPDHRLYTAFFGVPVQFGAEISGLTFDSTCLAQRPDASHATPAGIAADPSETRAFRALDIATRARRAVIACMAQGIVSVDSTAAFIGTSKRTLNRRLAERGTSTRELISEVRIQVACQLMRDTDLSVADIAATTCYSDAAAFSRAFSARIGLAPTAWRRQSTAGQPIPRD